MLDDIDQFQDQQYDCDNNEDMNPTSCPGKTRDKPGAECAEQPENQKDDNNCPHTGYAPFHKMFTVPANSLVVDHK